MPATSTNFFFTNQVVPAEADHPEYYTNGRIDQTKVRAIYPDTSGTDFLFDLIHAPMRSRGKAAANAPQPDQIGESRFAIWVNFGTSFFIVPQGFGFNGEWSGEYTLNDGSNIKLRGRVTVIRNVGATITFEFDLDEILGTPTGIWAGATVADMKLHGIRDDDPVFGFWIKGAATIQTS